MNPKMTYREALTLALRQAADLMHIHALCGRTRCRRARACRGNPQDCLRRCAPLVPQEARDGVKAMISGWERGIDFDELLDESQEQIEALGHWHELVARTCPGR